MSAEPTAALPAQATAAPGGPPRSSGTGLPRPRLITYAAELVVLAEELYLRLFTLALGFVLIAAALSIWFAVGTPAPLAVTLPFSVAVGAFAVAGLASPRSVYGWLRYSPARQLAPAALSALAMLPTGPDSPLWWPALALVILATSIGSLRLSLLAAVLNAGGYVAGAVIAGGAIIRGGEAGILAGAVGFIAYALVGWFVCAAFARFVLGFERLERQAAPAAPPRRVPSLIVEDDPSAIALPDTRPGAPRDAADADASAVAVTGAVPDRPVRAAEVPGSSLTPRQLEVALLIRDGLNQAETAASLGISRRQVERLLGDARSRAGASTTSQLVAMLVTGGLAP